MGTPAHLSAVSTRLLLGLTLFLLACAGPRSDEIRSFLLRSDTVDVAEASAQLITAIASELEESRSLRDGYPVIGRVMLEPDPSDPGVQIMHCTPAQLVPPTETHCIALNEQGDFLRAQAITWESAAFYGYRVYVVPRARSADVDPAKDFVALDVFLLEEESPRQAVGEAIRNATARIGARPFHP